jgi:hypothetical protein
MDTREIYKEKIEKQLSKWKTRIDELKARLERAEESAKGKLAEQLEGLHDKRARAEKLLKEISTTSQDIWEQIKSGVDEGWNDITRTAKRTMAKVREAIDHPRREEEIRQIAYHLWLDEGCPHGRHLDHWFKAESIWREKQAAKQPESPRSAKAKRKPTATAPQDEGRAAKTRTAKRNRSITRGVDKTQ